MKISSMKKSLLDYAIKGHLTSKFRRENPTLSAFAEIESFNAEIKQKRDLTQKTLKKLESSLKHEKDKDKKANLKAKITALKKELGKLREIEILNLTPLQTPPARGGAFSLDSPTIAEDAHTDSPSPCGRGLGGGVNSLTSKVNSLTSELNPLNNEANPFPFPIPASWAWVKLGDICEIFTGDSINATIKQKEFTGISNGLNYIGTKDIDFDGVIDYENGVKIPHEKLENFKIAKADSSLLCVEGGSAGRKVGFLSQNVCFGNKLCVFESILPEAKFVYFYLQNPYFLAQFNQEIVGIIGGVSKDKIKEFKIPLPPLQEQKAIAQRLDILVNLANDFEHTQEELKRIEKRIEKSLLKYAIEGHLSKRFRRENPHLNASSEIESFNKEIKTKRDSKQKALKALESSLKVAKEKDKKAHLKAEITALKKELGKLREITPLYPCHVESSPCHVEPSACHVERSETSLSPCHVEASAETSHKNCHVERSETSLQESAKNRDISFATQTQYDKNLTHNDKESLPFPIPASWAWVKLGDIVEIISGTSYGKSDLSYNQGIRILRGGNINDNNAQIDLFADDVFVASNLQDSEKIVQKDDILIVASTGSSRVIGKPAFAKKDFENTQIGAFLRIIRVKNKDFAKYTQYIFMSAIYRQYISDLASGTNILNIKNEYIENFKIPLPPLQEQKAIALKLEALFAISKGLKVE